MMTQAGSLFHSAPTSARKPGRQFGSKAQVVQDARTLGVHHFAFVRSTILGLNFAEYFERYPAWAETTTGLRYVQKRREAPLQRIIEAGRQHVAGISIFDDCLGSVVEHGQSTTDAIDELLPRSWG